MNSMNDNSTDPDVLDWLEREAVRALTGLSDSGIYRGVRQGTFPAPVKLSANVSRWLRHEVLAWRDERIAARGRRAA
jgi:prophage regulatory protein